MRIRCPAQHRYKKQLVGETDEQMRRSNSHHCRRLSSIKHAHSLAETSRWVQAREMLLEFATLRDRGAAFQRMARS